MEWGSNYIRHHWGQAVQVGMTTLWEAFDPAWVGSDPQAVSVIANEHAVYGGYRTSLYHAWSAGAAVWLHTTVLGVAPAEPCFAAVALSPALGDLDWAEGTIPTPRGPVQVSLHRRKGALPHVELTVPEGTDVHIPESTAAAWEVESHTSRH